MRPVPTNTSTIKARILPRRLRLVIEATVDEMEKKTSGTITVKSRLRKTSPSGLNMAASFFKTSPRSAPRIIEAIRSREKPYDFKKGVRFFFIILMSPERYRVVRMRFVVLGGMLPFLWRRRKL
jgi:hypothetical protein